MNKFGYIKTLFTTLVLLILSVSLINFIIDSEKIFKINNTSSEAEKFVIQMTNSKEPIFNIFDITRREIKKNLAISSTKKACAIVGSSRIWELKSNILSQSFRDLCPSLINLGLPGGSIEDIFIFSEILLNNPSSPNKIIIEIAPWTFNFGRDSRWIQDRNLFYKIYNKLGDENKYFVEEEIEKKYILKLASNLFNKDYLMSSLNILYKNFKAKFFTKKKINYYSLDSFNNEGANIYSQKFQDRYKENRNKKYSLNNYKIKKNQWTQDLAVIKFEELLTLLQEKFEVILILTPYHPDIFEKKDNNILTAIDIVQKKTHEISKEKNIKILGSFYPNIVGCEKKDFWDSGHSRESCLRKIKIQK